MVWDPSTGEPVTHLLENQNTLSVAFTHDGRNLLVGDERGRCFIFDTSTWETMFEIEAHRGSVMDIAVNPNQASFATCGKDGAIHVWDLPNPRLKQTLFDHSSAVNSISWNPLGTKLVSASSDKSVKIWDTLDSDTFKKFSIDSEKALTIEWTPSSEHLRCTTETGLGAVVDIRSGSVKKQPDQKLWLTDDTKLDEASTTKFIEFAKEKLFTKPTQYLFKVTSREKGEYYGFTWSENGDRIILMRPVGPYLTLEAWNISDKRLMQSWNTSIQRIDARWAPDNRRLAAAGGGNNEDGEGLEGWIYVFDAETGETIHKLRHTSERVPASSVSWDSTGSRIVSGNSTGSVCIWDAYTGKLLANGLTHQSRISSLAWSPDGKRIAVAGADGQLKLIDSKSCEELLDLRDNGNSISQLTWSPDGHRLAGIDSDGEVIVWDASRGYENIESDDYRREKIYELFAQANQFVRERKYDSALPLIDEFLSGEVDSFDGLICRARLYDGLRKYEMARADYARVTELYPNHAMAWNNKGLDELYLGRLADAIRSFTIAIEIDPDGAVHSFYWNRGKAFQRLERWQEALNDLRISYDQYNSLPAGCEVVGLLARLGDIEASDAVRKELLDRITDSTTDDEKQYVVWTFHAPGIPKTDLERALKIAISLNEKHSKYPESGRWLGYTLYRLGRYREAFEHISKSAKPIPNAPSVYCWYYMAMTHHQLGHHEQAVEWLKNANAEADKELAPENKPHWDHRNAIFNLRDEATKVVIGEPEGIDESLAVFKELFSLMTDKLGAEHPDTQANKFQLALAYRGTGKLDQAVLLFREIYQSRKSEFGLTHNATLGILQNLADTLSTAKEFDKAESLYRELLESQTAVGPDRIETQLAKLALGHNLFRQENFAAAEPLLLEGYQGLNTSQATGRERRLAAAIRRLVEFYTAWEKTDEAAKWQKEFETLLPTSSTVEH